MGDGISYETTTRLKYQIVSVDGDSKRTSVNNFVDNEFLSMRLHWIQNSCCRFDA